MLSRPRLPLLQQMRDAAERKKELEQQHQEAQQQLRQKQEEIATLTKVSESDKQASLDTIQTLESKVRHRAAVTRGG